MKQRSLVIKNETLDLYHQAFLKYCKNNYEFPTANRVVAEALRTYLNKNKTG